MKNFEYYLNNNSPKCSPLPNTYLKIKNYLSEYKQESDKKKVRDNLNITNLLADLEDKINRKVIDIGGVVWDDIPTEGHTDRVLSSDVVYKYLKLYALKSEVDAIWENFNQKLIELDEDIQKITGLSEILEFIHNVESEIEELNNKIDAYIESEPKHVFLTQEEYDSLQEYDVNTLYFIIERWRLGDNLPIILS